MNTIKDNQERSSLLEEASLRNKLQKLKDYIEARNSLLRDNFIKDHNTNKGNYIEKRRELYVNSSNNNNSNLHPKEA